MRKLQIDRLVDPPRANPLERLNREVKRRTNVVSNFLNGAAIDRLAILLEQND